MIQSATIKLDPRDAGQLASALLARRPGFVPEWVLSDSGAGYALTQITADYLQAIVQRLDYAPDKNKLAFLDLLGIQLIPATPARAPLVFRLSDNAADTRIPAGTRVAAPPPPESTSQIVFETERATGLSAAKLKQVFSLWPGRDQYIDHGDTVLAGQAIQPFKKIQLENTPHVLYLAHDTLLAFAGKSTVKVQFDLTTVSNEILDIVWEYWDGQVWREFRNMRPDCGGEQAEEYDATAGLTRSGRSFTLRTDCAQTAKTAVNDIQAFWIRGRLKQPLPLDPTRVLPRVDWIKLSTGIDQPFSFVATPVALKPKSGSTDVRVTVLTKGGTPLGDVTLEIKEFDGSVIKSAPDGNPSPGQYTFMSVANANPAKQVTVEFSVGTIPSTIIEQAAELFLTDIGSSTYEVSFTLSGLNPDKAFSDETALDLTKTFYPFGPQPQPGAIFYFTNEEIFSKAGADVKILLARVKTPQDIAVDNLSPAASTTNILPHVIAWEYWNGTLWVTLFQTTETEAPFVYTGSVSDFDPQLVELTIPTDMVRTQVNNQDCLWMRARLVSGGFGVTKQIQLTGGKDIFSFTVVQPPALSDLLFAYQWTNGPYRAEHVLAYNDFQYEDRTEEAKWPGNTFLPFKTVEDVTPALYLGFDKKLPVDRLGVFFDVVEEKGDTEGPALIWEYWNGGSWSDIVVEDETHNFRLPGLVSFIGPDDSVALTRFGMPLYWLRARLKEDGPPGEPTINGIYPNAVGAIQHQTIVDEPIGASTGQPNQVFLFRQFPVLDGERVEVREVAGRRANVEWRIVALEVFHGNKSRLADLESLLASDGTQTDIQNGDVRLTRDRNKRVIEIWVRWYGQRYLFSSGPNDRHYVVERARGRLIFGDGTNGAIPPLGSAIIARKYRTGGGLAGNVPAKKITQVLGPIGGIEETFNPRPAEGGGDSEWPDSLATRGPRTIQHRGRALTSSDYETLAREANASVAVARAIPCIDPEGHNVPGWVTLVIIPQSADPRPSPSFGLREEVRQFIAERGSADLVAADHIFVTGPDYVPVDLHATIVPLRTADPGEVELLAQTAVGDFLHPLRGGPDRLGWPPGRGVSLSDVAGVLERVDGVDYVEELELLLNGSPQGERLLVAPDGVVVAGDIRLKLKEAKG
jgi:hypothetical protein